MTSENPPIGSDVASDGVPRLEEGVKEIRLPPSCSEEERDYVVIIYASTREDAGVEGMVVMVMGEVMGERMVMMRGCGDERMVMMRGCGDEWRSR
ncbi:hypothetical protein SERLA73DRAFT_183050 [Serpula lacrymans var. lacrymans S7.3]|uniref:Uncharacterized protein n=2 Tax=Serpula lacrymans var. lacrymans TaxID=341189 RepID=F8Q1I2_SERL3|nr:uncharacterized protein SERLADRAFT_470024 [Serpula lacrymans var. lacrymans S7.9]EGN98160.1 hypothetical protein SERLA73DRAFT_183050 [Serpula lacrymans var. lacrymans S7.3]EGO23739.1 hypothetical protein SERLADRAFT_470024 [Serpula lacrymans var. lacrymans S7.9]